MGSSPFGCSIRFRFFLKIPFSRVQILAVGKNRKMDRYFFEKKQGRKNGRNLSKSPVFSCFLVRIDFDHTTWQGQEDSNPRPTVLESICGNASPPERSLFRNFSGVWKPCLRTAILIDTFLMLWKYFSAIAGSQNSHNFLIGGVLLQAPVITKYAAPDDL